LAASRRARAESYVAGGVALNALLATPRKSRDTDLFHDTQDALSSTWLADRELLARNGFEIAVLREARAFVEVRISRGGEPTVVQLYRGSSVELVEAMREGRVRFHPGRIGGAWPSIVA
jgi:hypothetical protein